MKKWPPKCCGVPEDRKTCNNPAWSVCSLWYCEPTNPSVCSLWNRSFSAGSSNWANLQGILAGTSLQLSLPFYWSAPGLCSWLSSLLYLYHLIGFYHCHADDIQLFLLYPVLSDITALKTERRVQLLLSKVLIFTAKPYSINFRSALTVSTKSELWQSLLVN